MNMGYMQRMYFLSYAGRNDGSASPLFLGRTTGYISWLQLWPSIHRTFAHYRRRLVPTMRILGWLFGCPIWSA